MRRTYDEEEVFTKPSRCQVPGMIANLYCHLRARFRCAWTGRYRRTRLAIAIHILWCRPEMLAHRRLSPRVLPQSAFNWRETTVEHASESALSLGMCSTTARSGELKSHSWNADAAGCVASAVPISVLPNVIVFGLPLVLPTPCPDVFDRWVEMSFSKRSSGYRLSGLEPRLPLLAASGECSGRAIREWRLDV